MSRASISRIIRARLRERRRGSYVTPQTSAEDVLRIIAVFSSGFLFAIGLGLSGMTKPSKVIGFLDVFGAWDPSLAFVMIGAISVCAILFRLIARLPSPLFGREFHLPRLQRIDRGLIIGSILFGIGWGVSGYCPGPAIVALASGSAPAAEFACAMLAGMLLYELKGR